jgi:hypothetical protein
VRAPSRVGVDGRVRRELRGTPKPDFGTLALRAPGKGFGELMDVPVALS